MRIIETPEATEPFVKQRVELTGKLFDLVFKFNFRREAWFLSLLDETGTVLLGDTAIVPGKDLFSRNPSSAMPGGRLVVAPRDDTPFTPGLTSWDTGAATLVYLEPGETVA